MADKTNVAIVLSREGMGQGNPELTSKLMANFLHALEAERKIPGVICVYAEGVRLVTGDSPVTANLKTLEALGAPILICGTCLDYYELREQVAVGTVSTMNNILAALFEADHVINL